MLVKRVLRYVAKTKAMVLRYAVQPNSAFHNQLQTWVDANYGGEAGNLHDARSFSGLALFMNGGAVMGKSTTQRAVAQSTAEAEYAGLSGGGRHLMYASNLAAAMGLIQKLPMVVLEDNQAAIAIASGPVSSTRTRHMLIRAHYIRDLVAKGYVKVVYCPTVDMVADIFTKPLDRIKFERFRDMLLGHAPVAAPVTAIPGMMAATMDNEEDEGPFYGYSDPDYD